ncbi:hypothetical protein LRS13_08205 [Svornostia abyssi]|uniref:Uncharacterized protein n=1 Tax=Svornostia abyssi TaxID=2898438 RepID=A0ABY5PLP2_9ACTN|nr:hypothetical protein LRS13_08205 [Parviterribacteraceae bacterium J379]
MSEESVLAVSMVEFFRRADGVSMGSDTMLLAVFPDSLSLAHEKRKLLSKSIETRVQFLRDVGAVSKDEREWPNGQGEFAIQALLPDGAPMFRIGWDWLRSGPEPRTRETALKERDRILAEIRVLAA